MQDDREARIRQRAHAMWEAEGRPPGRELDHWLRAEAEERAEGTGSAKPAKKVAGRKASRRKRPHS